jgi:hypothetical protein
LICAIQSEKFWRLYSIATIPLNKLRFGKIILRAAKGETHGDIAQALGVTKDTSRLWRRRWLELSAREVPVMERLYDAPVRAPKTPLILNKSRNSTPLPVIHQNNMVVPSVIGAAEN